MGKRSLVLAVSGFVASIAAFGSIAVAGAHKDGCPWPKNAEVLQRVLANALGAPASTDAVLVLSDADGAEEAQSAGDALRTVGVNAVVISDTSYIPNDRYKTILVIGEKPFRKRVASVAHSWGVVTVSSDPGCLTDGSCVIFVQTRPDTQVIISDEAMRAARARLDGAFQMMTVAM